MTPGMSPAARIAFASFVPRPSRSRTSSLTRSMPYLTTGRRSGSEQLIPAVEQPRHGIVVEDVADGISQNWRDRQHLYLVRAVERVDRDRVRDDDLLEHALLEPLERGAGEDGVGRTREHPRRALLHQRHAARAERPGGVDHVVEQDADLAAHAAD